MVTFNQDSGVNSEHVMSFRRLAHHAKINHLR